MESIPKQRPAGGAASIAVVALLIIGLPMLYVLAVGPIRYLVETGRLNADEGSVVMDVYRPLLWAADNCRPFGSVIESYANLWDPNGSPLSTSPPLHHLPAGS